MKRSSEASSKEQISGINEAETLACGNALEDDAVFSHKVGGHELGIEQSEAVQAAEPAEPSRSRHAREHFEEVESEVFFLAASPAMQKIRTQVAQVARVDIPVLLLGESGAGKEVLARLIHKLSRRAGKPLVKVNCAALPHDLLESELFGYEAGAFTGATRSKPGMLELCHQGTIFLDEIGEMSPVLQAKLLHVLQDGRFSRLGSRSSISSDFRVLAATNINVREAIDAKTFREDLYYRLNAFTVNVPPLRERREEIPVLAEYFMRKGARRYGREPLPFSPRLLDTLSAHNWPGNLRELENVVNRYLVLGDERAILEELAPASSAQATATPAEAASGAGLKALVKNLKGGAEAAAIAQVLEGTGWNRKAAANDLQISYKALLYKIKQYDLSPQDRA